MLNTRKLKVTDLNPHLICVLCGGYYIDATTIIECLHSFCRSCIVRYLESNKYCPICDVQVHKTRPLQNIRPDTTLQTIVYKLVPGLYQNEMQCRREFYAKHPEAKLQVQNPEARGELTDQSPIFLPDDQISICLEYMDSPESQQATYGRRYLRCPAAVTVLHLHKLIRAKFGLTSHKVDVMYKEDILLENWTLMDVAYIYQWRRKCPIHLTYRILEIRRKRVNLPVENAQSSVDESTAAKTPRKDNDTSVSTATEGSSANRSASESKKCPTYQLRISENGVMSVAGIENANRLLAPPQLVSVDDFESSVVKETITSNKNNLESTNKTEVDKTTSKTSASIPTSHSSSLTTSTSTSSKSLSSTSTTTSTSTSTSSPKAQAVKTSELGDNRTRLSESVNLTLSSKTAAKPCSEKLLVETHTSKVETNKPKDNNNVHNVKSANKPADSNNIGKTNIPIKAEANCREDFSQSKTEASIKSDSVCNSKKNTSRVETAKEEVSTKASKELSSNLVDIFACEPPRPPNTFKVYPGVKSTSTPITAPLPKDESSKQTFQKTNVASLPKPTPMEILNAAVPKKMPNSSTKYKTLKSPTKTWNPTVPRSTILSMKHPQAAVNQSKEPSPSTASDGANPPPPKQPKFFKLRNMPRFLGNPASGVKPMYQVAPGSEVVSQSPSTSANATPSVHKSAKTTNSSITLMKIDPKTLCPIPVNPVSHVLSSPPKTTSSPPPKKLPPPYTPGSPKTTNHYSSSRTVHSNASASKAPVPRIPSPAHTGALMPLNPFVAHTSPHLLYNTFPGPFSATDPSASRLLPGAPNTELIRAMSALCSSGAAYHPSLPPSISMLFNPHHPHHRLTQVDRAAFKSLTEDKTPSPPAVQRIPPSNALGLKSTSDTAQTSSSPSSSTSQTNSTKKEKVESDSTTKTPPTTTDQPKKIESGAGSKSSNLPPPVSEPKTQASSKTTPPAEKSTDPKSNSETNSPSKTKSVEANVNRVDNNSESKPVSSKESEKIKSNANSAVNSISCKAKVEKSPVNENQVDSSNLKEKKEIPKNNNYTNKAASFTEASKSNIMITTESSLKV